MPVTHYICKYTPVELLAAFGGTCAILNHMPENFDLSDQVSHPNLCGFGKALLETCLEGNVRELVLVNCCDTIRSAYDVLLEYGELDFLFLLDMLHADGECSRERTKRELLRLAKAYGAYKGTEFDFSKFQAAFQPVKRPDGPYLSVLGGRVGEELFSMMEETMPLPVRNDTCVHNRSVPPPEGEADFDALMDWYAGALLGQMPCMRMTDITGRKQLVNDPHLRGVIYHTVKFCDYYGFEYSELRRQLTVPLLKLESDYTIQSSGQLRTRLEAFAESIAPERTIQKGGTKPMKGKGLYAGIDSGSTSTDVVILNQDREIVAQAILPTGAGAAAGADRALDEALGKAGLTREDITATVTTGYGRGAIQLGDQSITEITCHAKGAFFLAPSVRTIIDIGGQDSKVIRVDEAGNVVNFVMNDKCAAGTGRFLELMARTLELSLDEMSTAGLDWKEDVTISSMCTVFAESEVVSLIAQNKTPADIIHGLNRSVASKTVSLCRRVGGEEAYMMTGGVSKNRGVAAEIEKLLGVKLHISEKAQLNGALGAALFALEL
ncbi:acyl-CoA dehydratase activase [uncultured Intestinimonas sp.]|uniref:acyl-CoA dehydratase activase n=1 Tax=uncultured Intestinimonas sp. TaxID=1689265 RepID=UPI0025F438BB|nr:acyl-CoA dehydratase activase [uncultured Intestinimonas sp.]